MDRGGVLRSSCVVCGIETKRHVGWFLVMDNCWLDRVKILSWHPVLAKEIGMRSVCGKLHLKALLTYWLNHASLDLPPARIDRVSAPVVEANPARSSETPLCYGKVLGELAVERESVSEVWTGSPETMECILNALLGETELRSRGLEVSPLERLVGYSQNYAFR